MSDHTEILALAKRVLESYGKNPESEGGRLARAVVELVAENERLRQALEILAQEPNGADAIPVRVCDIARAALGIEPIEKGAEK